MVNIKPQPGIMKIDLYEGGASELEGHDEVVKLSSNENPFGPSSKAVYAYSISGKSLHRYPSTSHDELRQAISRIFDLQPENIICGVGSDEIISLLCQTFSGQGDEVIYTEHGFAMYKISALAAGANPIAVKEKNRTTDINNILNKCNENTKLIFIANPNNPTGTMITLKQIKELALKIPKQTLLVLDGAYAEYVDNYDGGIQLAKTTSNVIMIRTFSKIYGLGGMRVGWGFGSKPIIEALQRVRGPFNLSLPALAVAEAAIKDQDYVKRCKEENNATRDWLISSLRKLGLACDESFTNFVLLRFKTEVQAELCDRYLRSKSFIVRRVDGYNLPESLRITVSDRKTCERLVRIIEEFLVGQK
tara:strand:- start:5 stop:1090 length:1086 start_codon:yes stop_codon:yes gene_type:complete